MQSEECSKRNSQKPHGSEARALPPPQTQGLTPLLQPQLSFRLEAQKHTATLSQATTSLIEFFQKNPLIEQHKAAPSAEAATALLLVASTGRLAVQPVLCSVCLISYILGGTGQPAPQAGCGSCHCTATGCSWLAVQADLCPPDPATFLAAQAPAAPPRQRWHTKVWRGLWGEGRQR